MKLDLALIKNKKEMTTHWSFLFSTYEDIIF